MPAEIGRPIFVTLYLEEKSTAAVLVTYSRSCCKTLSDTPDGNTLLK